MGCASSTPLTAAGGPSPEAPPYDLRPADSMAGDDSVAGKVRQTVTGMADALPVQDMIDGVTHAKDDAFHKLQDFGETVKDKVESVVEDVEDKIGSALGTVKEKTSEATEEVSAAQEEVEKAAEEVEEMAEKKAEEEAKDVVDTMVEDLEESLPLPEKQNSEENKDFQMNTPKGSRASTAEMSRKSGDEVGVNDVKGNEEEKREQQSINNNSSENKISEEENNGQEQSEKSPMKSGETSPAPKETTEDSGLVLQIDETTSEDPIVAETITPIVAIPIEKDETPKEELKEGDEKDNAEEKEQLTVDLPPEDKVEKERVSPSGGQTPGSQNDPSSPPAHIDTPRPPSDHEDDPNVEPPIEKAAVTPSEGQPENETTTPNSPDGKNDSAISSSSLSPEPEVSENMEERQGTPVIEVA